ncbi:hypothetical protein ZIOFF_068105 [Zingiber officinale]|uniref:SET domain-containing protein n=1 Tax=Zingiber officinale TaxID=94328 RepID=A0A8J5EVK4_ZINOF|nr:hypothetical protein ZIOFF_068105 [Zingiber officinale]
MPIGGDQQLVASSQQLVAGIAVSMRLAPGHNASCVLAACTVASMRLTACTAASMCLAACTIANKWLGVGNIARCVLAGGNVASRVLVAGNAATCVLAWRGLSAGSRNADALRACTPVAQKRKKTDGRSRFSFFSSSCFWVFAIPTSLSSQELSQLGNGDNACSLPPNRRNVGSTSHGRRRRVVAATSVSTSSLPPFKFFEPPKVVESPFPLELEPADPDFYRIGYARSVRAYGVEFREGPDGFGVYASKDVDPLRRARVIMEIPLELMLTISQKHPWMFFPDIVPVGHPIFDIINSTKPETDWDHRLACLLLHAFDVEDNFWQLYGDFLPSSEECTSLLLAHKDDLLELQDHVLASKLEEQQKCAIEFWEQHWHSAAPLKIKRLARDVERFLWALSIVQSRAFNMKIRVGALVQDANMLVPYAGLYSYIITTLIGCFLPNADMLNHSFRPNCFLHWRYKDRMLEVLINAGQRIKKGEEVMLIGYR